jgi:hypothetical protein
MVDDLVKHPNSVTAAALLIGGPKQLESPKKAKQAIAVTLAAKLSDCDLVLPEWFPNVTVEFKYQGISNLQDIKGATLPNHYPEGSLSTEDLAYALDLCCKPALRMSVETSCTKGAAAVQNFIQVCMLAPPCCSALNAKQSP